MNVSGGALKSLRRIYSLYKRNCCTKLTSTVVGKQMRKVFGIMDMNATVFSRITEKSVIFQHNTDEKQRIKGSCSNLGAERMLCTVSQWLGMLFKRLRMGLHA